MSLVPNQSPSGVNHPSPADLYATDPDRTFEGAVKILRNELRETQASARLAALLLGRFEGAQADGETLALINLRLSEVEIFTARL